TFQSLASASALIFLSCVSTVQRSPLRSMEARTYAATSFVFLSATSSTMQPSLRERVLQPRYVLLDADEVRVAGVAVEQDALDEVVTDHLAVVVGLHLHARLVLRGMEADEVGVEPPQRRRGLQRPGTELQSPE